MKERKFVSVYSQEVFSKTDENKTLKSQFNWWNLTAFFVFFSITSSCILRILDSETLATSNPVIVSWGWHTNRKEEAVVHVHCNVKKKNNT